jgi:hypothetical protein
VEPQAALPEFGFEIIPADPDANDRKSPGPRIDPLKLEWVTDGTQYALSQTIVLDRYPAQRGGGIRPVFLVWQSEAADGFRIMNAHYTLERQDLGNRIEPNYDSRPASLDRLDRWFIPLLDPRLGPPEDLDGQTVGRIHLTFQSVDNQVREIWLSIRLVAPLPEIQAKTVDPLSFFLLQASLRKSGTGQALSAEDYANPTQRKLALWIRSQGELVQFQTVIATLHPGLERAGVVREKKDRLESRTSLSADSAQITRKNQPPELIRLGDEPSKVLLGPGETVRLTWLARADSGRCTLAPDIDRSFPYTVQVSPGRCFGPRGTKKPILSDCIPPEFATRTARATDTWRLASTQTRGKWDRLVVLTTPEVRVQDIEARSFRPFPESMRVLIEDHPVTIGEGVEGAQSLPGKFSCQGFVIPAS